MRVRRLPIDLFVPGIPAPQGSKDSFVIKNKEGEVVGRNVVESNKATRPWRVDIKHFAQEAVIGRGTMLVGPIRVWARFVMPRTKAMSDKKSTPPHTKKPDCDKLLRAVGDALKGVVYTDDSQVIEWHGTKRTAEPGEPTGVHLTIGEVPWPDG